MGDGEPMDDDGYPTDETLERIAAWKFTTRGELHALIDHIRDIWAYADAGYFGVTEEHGEPPTWKLSTAGWSGNESVIEALQRNTLFWLVCWQSSRRGGHYEFRASGIRFPDDQCAKRCDHDSQCTRRADHPRESGHESEHGCVFYDAKEPA
jgi:hypothetical protein